MTAVDTDAHLAERSPVFAVLQVCAPQWWWPLFRLAFRADPLEWFSYQKPDDPSRSIVVLDGLPWLVHSATGAVKDAGHHIEEGFSQRSEFGRYRKRFDWTIVKKASTRP